MARRKTTDRHKDNKIVRIKGRLGPLLDTLAKKRETDATEEANRAVRELLEREGLWPPGKEK